MSLKRFVYYCAVVGGWAALVAWAPCELLFLRSHRFGGLSEAVLAGATVGALVGAGLQLVSGMSNSQWTRQLRRAVPGFLGGAVGGAAGALFGAAVYSGLGVPRAVGWMIMGLGIGSSEGIYERSGRKIRNGLIGGAVGGLLGGLLFDPIKNLAPAGLWTFSRACGFVILGMSIGVMIGLAQVVLKEAWLTVLDGYRPGRELILSQAVTTLGRGDHLPLPFLGYSARELESEHARITRRQDGTYLLEDNGSRIGTRLNGELIAGPRALKDGDLIRLAANIVRFNQRERGPSLEASGGAGMPTAGGAVGLPVPPPVATLGHAGPPLVHPAAVSPVPTPPVHADPGPPLPAPPSVPPVVANGPSTSAPPEPPAPPVPDKYGSSPESAPRGRAPWLKKAFPAAPQAAPSSRPKIPPPPPPPKPNS